MAIEGNGFNLQLMKSKVFANAMRKFFSNQDGIINRCAITNTSTQVTIGDGLFVASGYLTSVIGTEVIGITGLANGLYSLVYEIDLTKTNTTSVFNQGSFKLINTTPVKQDLFDGAGTKYQLAFLEVTIVGGLITGTTTKIQLINGQAITTAGGQITGNLGVSGTVNASSLTIADKRVSDVTKGTTAPDNANGQDNDIYIQYEA